MTSREEEKLLVRGVGISGSGSQWTLLGTSENAAAQSVQSVRHASARLDAWAKSALAATEDVEVVTVQKFEIEPSCFGKKARQVNGVSKALSPEYKAMFSTLAADFIAVETALFGPTIGSK